MLNKWIGPTFITRKSICYNPRLRVSPGWRLQWELEKNILTVSFKFFPINAVIIAVSMVSSEKFNQNKLYKYELNCRQTPDTKWDLEPSGRSGALF